MTSNTPLRSPSPGRPVRGLSPEQVLSIADVLATRLPCTVHNYQALAAIAGASTPRMCGIPLIVDARELARGVADVVLALSPLSAHNEAFADLIFGVILALNEQD